MHSTDEGDEAIGLDIKTFAFTHTVGSITDRDVVRRCMRGVDVVLYTATLHKPDGDAFAPRFRRHQPCGYAQSLDVRTDDSVQARVEAVHRRCGYLDVLINNARYEQAGAQEELSPQAGPHQSLAVMAGATS